MKRLIIATIALVSLGSCAKEENTTTEPTGDVAVKFANAQIASRTSGDEWDANDEIGIYMTDTDNTVDDDRTNVHYKTDASGNFSIYDSSVTPIYYPQSTSDLVTFNAYYPYVEQSNDLIEIDITKQNTEEAGQGAIDFMVAEITGASKTTATEAFEFNHCLSMLVLELTHNNELSTLTGVETTIEKVSKTANFNVLTGEMDGSASGSANITFAIDSDSGDKMTVSAILLPGTIANETKIKFIQGSDFYVLTLSGALTLAKGTKYIYSVIVGKDTVLYSGDSEIKDWNEEEKDDLYSQE